MAGLGVTFSDKPFDVAHLAEKDEPYKCPVCWKHKKEVDFPSQPDRFIVHGGSDGKLHPAHHSCVIGWIKNNKTCPVCQVKITNKLISPIEVARNTLQESGNAASKGAESVSSVYVFGAFAVTTCVALILFGEWATRDTLAVSGGGYGMAYLAGLYARFTGNGAGADARIEQIAPIAAATGFIASVIPLFTRATQGAYLLQGLAVYGFAKSAGFAKVGLSAGAGLATAFATRLLFRPDTWEKTLTALTGGVGTLVNGIDSTKWINIVPTLAGMSASWCAYDKYGPFLSAAIGAGISGIAGSIFRRAYGDKQPVD